MSKATIRSAEPGTDSAACAGIYAPYVEDAVTSFEEHAPGAGDLAARILESHAWLVAELEGEVVGFAYAGRHRSRPAYRWAVDVSVYVDGDHLGRGLGRALYEGLLAELRPRGFRVACAGITLPNEASVGLHEGLGFEPVGVYRRIGWKQGGWHDVGWWQLDLSPGGADPPPEPL